MNHHPNLNSVPALRHHVRDGTRRHRPAPSSSCQRTPEKGFRRALLLEDIHESAAMMLREAGFLVDRRRTALTETELIEAVRGVEVLGIRSGTRVTRQVLARATDLAAVGAFCVGTNQIDLAAATDHGLAVFNAPHSNSRSVVELALAEIIALSRRLPVHNGRVHAGIWRKSSHQSNEIRGRTLGIVGYGSIGSQLSLLAEALGMSVAFYDLVERRPRGNAVRCSSLHDLLAASDVVTVHVDGRPENTALFGEAQFAAMKQGALFLNLSRGPVIDVTALQHALERGHLSGAAVDVYPEEPTAATHGFTSRLQGLPNVILTPHVAGSTQEALRHAGTDVSQKLTAYLDSGCTASSVNLPHLSLPTSPDARRIRLLQAGEGIARRVVQDVVARHTDDLIACAFAEVGQVLYGLIDVPPARTSAVAEAVRQLPQTIRVEPLRADVGAAALI